MTITLTAYILEYKILVLAVPIIYMLLWSEYNYSFAIIKSPLVINNREKHFLMT